MVRLFLVVGAKEVLPRNQVRDYSGYRHAAAARCRTAVRERHGAPVERGELRRARGGRGQGGGDVGVRHPAASGGGKPALPEPVAVRAAICEAGVDQYTRTVSDVYQDVFGEGSFIGKGIYDVDAFERALKGRFPANAY